MNTKNLDEMMSFSTTVADGVGISIKLRDDGYEASFKEENKALIKARGNTVLDALTNLEKEAIIFLGEDAI